MTLRTYIQTEPDEALSLLRLSFPRQMNSEITVGEKVDIAFHHILTAEEAVSHLPEKSRAPALQAALHDFNAMMPKEPAYKLARVEIARVASSNAIDFRM